MHDDLHPREFSPDLLTPVQFYPEAFRRQTSGMRRLMAALLEDTANIYLRHAGSGETSRLFQEAKSWVESDDRLWPFSFERVCEALQLDAEWVRGRLRSARNGTRAGAVDSRPGGRRRARAARRGSAVRRGRGGMVSIAVLSRALDGLPEHSDDDAPHAGR
jgi:hypothetical protein